MGGGKLQSQTHLFIVMKHKKLEWGEKSAVYFKFFVLFCFVLLLLPKCFVNVTCLL